MENQEAPDGPEASFLESIAVLWKRMQEVDTDVEADRPET